MASSLKIGNDAGSILIFLRRLAAELGVELEDVEFAPEDGFAGEVVLLGFPVPCPPDATA
jgi:hypothetical protein